MKWIICLVLCFLFQSNLQLQYILYHTYKKQETYILTILMKKEYYLYPYKIFHYHWFVLCENGICETFVDANTNDIEFDCYKGIVEREIECFINHNQYFEITSIDKLSLKVFPLPTQIFPHKNWKR